jgi:hypothetical protein
MKKRLFMMIFCCGICLSCVQPVRAGDYQVRRDKAQWQAILAYFRMEPEAYLFHSNERDRYDLLMMQAALANPGKLRGLQKLSLMMQKQQWVETQREKGAYVPGNGMVVYLEMMLESEGLTTLSPASLLGVPFRYSWQQASLPLKGGDK